MNSETQRDSSVILRLTRDLQPENLRPLQVGEVQMEDLDIREMFSEKRIMFVHTNNWIAQTSRHDKI